VGSGPFPTELHDGTGESLRKGGHEFGSTTGRPRRCGWLDLPALKYAIMLNGVSSLIMMKADVLSSLDRISICTTYEISGEHTDRLPYELSTPDLKPVYAEMEGWNSEIGQITRKEDLPAAMKNYIGYIEKSVKLPVGMISVGPDRTQTITV